MLEKLADLAQTYSAIGHKEAKLLIEVGCLPAERVIGLNPEDLSENEEGMNALISKIGTARTTQFIAYSNFVFMIV